jgi:hypothetical protein
MAATLIGTVKYGGAYSINSKKGPQTMVSFTVVDEMGTGYSCQMWSDDPQQPELAKVIEQARRLPVKCTVVSYTARERTDQNGNKRLQVNFVVTDVSIQGLLSAPGAA